MTSDMRDHEEMLAAVDVFAGLSRRQVKKVLDRAREVSHGSGQQVAAEGHEAFAFHLILSGSTSVSVAGRQVRTLGTGDYFGEISMIDGKPRSATVTTLEPTRTLAILHQDFLRLLAAEPDFARGLLEGLCARIREAETR